MPQSRLRVPLINLESIQEQLKALIEAARESWTYAIFWRCSESSMLDFPNGYYKGEEDKGKGKDEATSKADQNRRKQNLNLLFLGSPVVTNMELFFWISMTQSFVDEADLPGLAFFSSSLVWVTGADQLSASACKRARWGQEFGLQTLVCIPSMDAVVELGSTELILKNSDMISKVRVLLERIRSTFEWNCTSTVQADQIR